MKSFADWTDEIRALMNPPAPMADTCNLSALERGTAIHTVWEKRLEDWPRTIGFDLGEPGGDMTATGRTKSRIANERYQQAVQHLAGIQWDKAYIDTLVTGKGAVRVIHDEIQHVPVDDLATPLYVVGPQLKIAERWVNSQGWLSGPFKYISNAEQLRGMARGTELVMLVNWHSNKTKEEIDNFCECIATYELKVRLVQL